jgi:hypothetical protein
MTVTHLRGSGGSDRYIEFHLIERCLFDVSSEVLSQENLISVICLDAFIFIFTFLFICFFCPLKRRCVLFTMLLSGIGRSTQ